MLFGSTIKFIRSIKKITQKELADLIGISVTALVAIELNRTLPRIKTFKKILECLNVSYNDFCIFAIRTNDLSDKEKEALNLLTGYAIKRNFDEKDSNINAATHSL